MEIEYTYNKRENHYMSDNLSAPNLCVKGLLRFLDLGCRLPRKLYAVISMGTRMNYVCYQ